MATLVPGIGVKSSEDPRPSMECSTSEEAEKILMSGQDLEIQVTVDLVFSSYIEPRQQGKGLFFSLQLFSMR